jgi:hypothetical protein
MSAPRVEFLWWSECPSWERALVELREEVVAAGLDPAQIELRQIRTETEAMLEDFVGSPSIRIDGADPTPPTPGEVPALTCRLYRLEDGRPSPLPDRSQVRKALAARAQA